MEKNRFGTLSIIICENALKTLFNIVEAPFKFFLKLWCLCCIMMSDGPINSQEYKSFEIYEVTIKISMTELSPLNKRSGLPIDSNTTVYGEKWVR